MTKLNNTLTEEGRRAKSKEARELTAEEIEHVSGGINPQPLPPRGDD